MAVEDDTYIYEFSYRIESPISIDPEELEKLRKDCLSLVEPVINARVPRTSTWIKRIAELFE